MSAPALAESAPEAPPAPRSPDKHTVHWFRKGLRLHDNPALREGLLEATTFRCVFLVDPWFASTANVGINKWRFLLQCLEDLDKNLRKLNSRLFVVRGQPADVLPKLFREWGTTELTFEEDPEPYGRVRDQNIASKCREVGITVVSRVSHTLYRLDSIIEKNGGKAPLTYHQFQALVASMPAPIPAEPSICKETLNGATTPIDEDHDERFGVPTLEELGFDTDYLKPPIWIGGENEGLERLGRHLERKAWVASFGRPKMTPQSLLASQTGLSPYLRFGCLSTRLFYSQLTELYKRVKGARPPLSLHGQLLWREFFYCAATRNPNFDKMEGNPICVQIPWMKNPDALAKWATGRTGFPWIDAIMIQLREEGWIHHLARHAVACFLTRGDLWISWEEGMKVFDEHLLDADWSNNAGMWMWLSCSSFFQQFFHCYCPVRFGRKADPNGDFIRRYIPALKNIPTQYIHEPWMTPEPMQRQAQCILGHDYPMPMLDHNKASQINIERIKQVYAQLAKFKPQGALATPFLQRPNLVQSSPSPTSVISSINQSNYLCSKTPEPQASTTPPQPRSAYKKSNNYENRDIFTYSNPNKVSSLPEKGDLFKRIIFIKEKKYENTADKNIENYTEDDNQIKKENTDNYSPTNQNPEQKYIDYNNVVSQDNYNMKNLCINSYQNIAIPNVYNTQQLNRYRSDNQKSQNFKMNFYNETKEKYVQSSYPQEHSYESYKSNYVPRQVRTEEYDPNNTKSSDKQVVTNYEKFTEQILNSDKKIYLTKHHHTNDKYNQPSVEPANTTQSGSTHDKNQSTDKS